MEKWQDPTESQKMEHIRQTFQNYEMPVDSFSDSIMKRIGDEGMEKRATRKNGNKILKKSLVAASAAAVLGAGIIGSGFVSPVMAETLKQIPVVGSIFKGIDDKGLNAAEEKGLSTAPNQSVTHDGVTLKVTDAYYDGSRLAFAIEREGIDNDKMMAEMIIEPIEFDPSLTEQHAKVTMNQSEKGLLGSAEVKLPNEKKLESQMSSFGDVEGKKNAILYDYRNLNNIEALGDEFELSISVPVTQIAEPFVIKVPVKKVTEGIIKLDLNQTKEAEEFSYTITKLELTPATSRLQLSEEGKAPTVKEKDGYTTSEMFYEIVDELGNAFSSGGSFNLPAIVYPLVDKDFIPFAQTPKTITVKPFTYSIDENHKALKDEEGKLVKHYYPELEQTIQVEQK
ncbi:MULTISPECIES: DUF4179 domain-containing protein [Paenibacillus]|uniref:DUF4179 domain-containing protein n=1 Tax=Paenibacillus TaxID=44249 RepID=UPI00096C0CBF|nr:DUF4179 domain-containing protein [Paenibacillus odorifer]OMD09180.1 hypothetical protein BJP50_30110 [Paenibacillus odorifer]